VVVEGAGITHLNNNSWIRYDNFDFGNMTDLITINAATPNKGGMIEVRIDSFNSEPIALVDVTYTGSWTHFRPFTAVLNSPISHVHTLYLKFIDSNGVADSLFNMKSFAFGARTPPAAVASTGNLSVYPAVPGLATSPYYTFSVQKVFALNNPDKALANNWLSPFAWFTECVENGSPNNTAYYSSYIGGWSQTYCNFEMDRDTPIVVKITRLNNALAPSGPIFMANAHPAQRVDSCELINGDVYVTMSKPAQVTIDIDGQMDTRDLPRAKPDGWDGDSTFSGGKRNGCHAVSIFANPFITDKPAVNGPGVFAVEPGGPSPAASDTTWTTLYFKPGIHTLSVDASGNPRL